ncbi:hypothetical protein ACPV5L_05140 [Vibrio astriarenae]
MKGILLVLLVASVAIALVSEQLVRAIAELTGFISLVALILLTKNKTRAKVKFEAEDL